MPFGLSLSKPCVYAARPSTSSGPSTGSGCTGPSTSSGPSTGSGCTGPSTSSGPTGAVVDKPHHIIEHRREPAQRPREGADQGHVVDPLVHLHAHRCARVAQPLREAEGVALRVDQIVARRRAEKAAQRIASDVGDGLR